MSCHNLTGWLIWEGQGIYFRVPDFLDIGLIDSRLGMESEDSERELKYFLYCS